MRAGLILFGLALAPLSLANPKTEPLRNAVISGLKWHYRWIESIPRNVSSLECSIATFEQRSFAYCEPLSLSLDVNMTEDRGPRILRIGHELWGFQRALASFRTLRNPGQALGPIRRVSISRQELSTCKVDWNITERAAATVLSPRQRMPLEKEGLEFRYPVICEGDPFYFLYLIKDSKITSIWQFAVAPRGLNLTWSFDAGTQQRKIPELAAENLNKNELWYKPPR